MGWFRESDEHNTARLARKTENNARLRAAWGRPEAESKDERAQAKAEAVKAGRLRKADLAVWRDAHPLEKRLNTSAMLTMWPKVEFGRTAQGFMAEGGHPLASATAELFQSGKIKRGMVTGLAKGHASINLVFADGHVSMHTVSPEKVRVANQYVTLFNAYAQALANEDTDPTAR